MAKQAELKNVEIKVLFCVKKELDLTESEKDKAQFAKSGKPNGFVNGKKKLIYHEITFYSGSAFESVESGTSNEELKTGDYKGDIRITAGSNGMLKVKLLKMIELTAQKKT